MNSKHKFYCQHHNNQGVHDELVKVHLKSEFEMVVKYEDTDCETKFKLVLNKHRVERFIEMMESSYQGEDGYESPKIVMEDGDTELYIENQDCAAAMHHVIAFEDGSRYECVHLSSSDLLLLSVIVGNLNRKMNY
ncbi:hypothetical protein PPISBEST_13 [Bacillus phage PPIsBest]|uniref:Uncharacterized protein n=1 Tax=Bacillus phage PPIsBest TaxID=2024234 RepID=A0A222Z103_9CAUD|nr:hypothetical protein BIZ89_gp013 [Bacillus phage Kida]ANU80068.1 hypothetical protein KIDA_13 [Bacillus phage Kida]ASR78221.1 hypothetical protein PPISBEST_13 [Bacillus phage PPIsBest]